MNVLSYVPDDCDKKIRRAVEYWLSIHPASGLPGRQHFDPVDVPEILPSVRLIETSDNPPKFKIRLMGTKMVEYFERDFTGFWLHDAFPDFQGSPAEKSMIATVLTGQPDWYKGAPSFFYKKDYQNIQRIMLPLAGNGHDVDMILLVQTHQ